MARGAGSTAENGADRLVPIDRDYLLAWLPHGRQGRVLELYREGGHMLLARAA